MAATMPQQYCLRWKHHHSNVQSMFAQLLEKERFCDVTLYCSPSFASQLDRADRPAVVDPGSIQGVSLRAHRVVLAACSELLGGLLALHEPLGEPVIVIDGARPEHVRALLAYMYTGEMSVHHSQLPSLLRTAEELKIKGLTDIRWSSEDGPPDCRSGAITTTAASKHPSPGEATAQEPRDERGDERGDERSDSDRYSVNGGPPPLIKLPSKESPVSPALPSIKREPSCDHDSPSPEHKRRRLFGGGSGLAGSGLAGNGAAAHEDDDWRHGSLDISAERVQWGGGEDAGGGAWGERGDAKGSPGADDDEEWGDAPADIGSFLHTRLRVDGDNSCEDSNEGPAAGEPSAQSAGVSRPPGAVATAGPKSGPADPRFTDVVATAGPKSGPADPRFTDVVKLNDYLRHGRRPQFWEEDYVKRVMEAIRLKELEMKQAAEILGVSYGTLYGRYRDAYGCINRPFRSGRELWAGKGSGEVLGRLQRGELPLDVAAQALGVSARDLYAHFGDLGPPDDKFEPIPIEIDPSLRLKTPAAFAAANINMNKIRKSAAAVERAVQRVLVGSLGSLGALGDDDSPTSVGAAPEPSAGRPPPAPGCPSLLLRSRPDLTIVAARKAEARGHEARGHEARGHEARGHEARGHEAKSQEANGSS